MRTLLFTILLFGFSLFCFGQEGTITIEQDPKIEQLVEIYKSANNNSGYYQIQVGFGGHREAQNLKSNVDIDFPGWYSKIDFKEPTYRVRLGKFKTKMEAQRRLIEVRKKYPNAFLLPQKINT
ncbi:SPOR domain-containing protein [Croceitalea sp. MTPC9]|uniref:SPOR domain-containing protein n=1 Tax=unclassified Croceitalea TaxID=2632280 RepID=UPI002B3967D5|nr:SPOR domain-containing protein [Croceitalea sp. MTPC6]GMN18382.1 SPOR domain-containing protein [Croceitalea sp. MTPC9]